MYSMSRSIGSGSRSIHNVRRSYISISQSIHEYVNRTMFYLRGYWLSYVHTMRGANGYCIVRTLSFMHHDTVPYILVQSNTLPAQYVCLCIVQYVLGTWKPVDEGFKHIIGNSKMLTSFHVSVGYTI